MASKNGRPFFSELGKILNLIRNISTELNTGIKVQQPEDDKAFNLMQSRDTAIEKLQSRLQQLETEIEYFFTETGLRKTIEDRFNTEALKRKFSNALKSVSKEFSILKQGRPDKANEEALNDISTVS